MMNEYIRTIFLLNKAETFAVIKPLYDSISHSDILLYKDFHGSQLQVATIEKWVLPSEKNRLTIKGEPS